MPKNIDNDFLIKNNLLSLEVSMCTLMCVTVNWASPPIPAIFEETYERRTTNVL